MERTYIVCLSYKPKDDYASLGYYDLEKEIKSLRHFALTGLNNAYSISIKKLPNSLYFVKFLKINSIKKTEESTQRLVMPMTLHLKWR